MRLRVINVGCALIVAGCICSSAAFLPSRHALIEIFQSLGWYFLLGHLLALAWLGLAYCIERRFRKILFVLNLPFIALYGYILGSWYIQPERPLTCAREAGPEFSAVFANVYKLNTDIPALRRQIENADPDFVGLAEVDLRWLKELSLFDRFPAQILVPRDDFFGIALFSKHPLQAKPEGFGSDLRPSVYAEVTDGAFRGLRIGVLHAMPPRSTRALTHNRILFRRIATEFRHSSGAVLVMGDFNATIFSSSLRTLLWGSELVHAGRGGAYFSTWNAQSALHNLMIDHMLIDPCMTTRTYERGQYFGSDHYPLLARIEMATKQ